MIDLKSEDAGQMQLIEREDIDDEEDLFEATDKLISQGINAGDVKKLQDAGIYTCNGLMMQTKKNLTGMNGISEAKFDKIREAAEKLVNFGYVTGSDVLLRRKSVVKIATGSQALDELLGGGIETLCTTEAFGEFRSGKTQLAHTLCVSTQLPINMRGGNGKVAYTDTEGTFRPDRIVPIAERFGMDAGAVFDNIIYVRAYTYEHQYNLLLGLAAKIAEEPFRLLIVDSVIALFRVDFTGRGELAECQQKLAQMLSRMTKIAEEFNVSLYMTNQVVADPGGGMFISDLMTPAGGHVLAHAATIRLMFRKGKNSAHTLCVSTQLPAEDSDDYNGQDQEQEGDSLGQYAGSEEDMEEKESDSNKEEKNNTGYDMSEQDWLWSSVSDYYIDEDQILKIYVTRYSDEVTECLDLPRFETDEEFLQYCRDQVYKGAPHLRQHLRHVDVSYLNKDGLEQPFEIGSWKALNFQFYEVYACPRNFLLNLPVCVPLLYEIKTETGENVEDVIHVTSKFDISVFDSLLGFALRLKETYPALSIDCSYWYNRMLPDDKRAFSDSEKARWKCFQRSVHKIVICPKPTERVSTLLREKCQKDLKNWEEGEFDFGSSEE